jgi:superfamily II DNA or RNA helicase
MNVNDLVNGVIIQGPKWSELIEVKTVDRYPEYVHIIGVTTSTRIYVDQMLSESDLPLIKTVAKEGKFDSDPWKVFLSLETKRYRFATIYDPLLAVNVSKVDPLPHQIEAVYSRVLKLPRIRFLIADDPGAGKTIMAGLIIKELKLRNLAKRILIVVPGHLIDQWRRELKDRFEESFNVINRGLLDESYGENVWSSYDQIIASMDFLKKEDIIRSLDASRFDLVIVDEAHKMSAYRYGNKTQKTARYKLGETLSKVAEPHLLFLTATPHSGNPENFRLFIDLLEPGFFSSTKMLEESIKNKDNPLFIRRTKEDLTDFNGKPIFLPRHVATTSFRLSDEEKKLYNDVSKYVQHEYNRATILARNRNVTFALIILQRRMASSVYALLQSLERRRKRLEEILESSGNIVSFMNEQDKFMTNPEDVEELAEEERWIIEEKWETLSVASSPNEMKSEISTLEKLIFDAKKIVESENEVKLRQLKDTISRLNSNFPGTKILIFTESKDTLFYIENKIKMWGYTCSIIHGGLNLEEKVQAEITFRNETQIMVATEAAGEGINLQFCNFMINYDLPWNPNRLEQRMGRIHRYGQTKEVFVYNLIASDTREGIVLQRIFEKLEEIRRAMESDKVFDVISDVFYGKDLSELMIEAASSSRNIDEILEDVEIKVDEEYISKIRENLGESLATKFIDYTRLKELQQKAKENRLIPQYTELFFRRAFQRVNGRIKERKDGFLSIESVPFEIVTISKSEEFRRRYGTLMRNYPKVTFDKETASKAGDAEFMSFGHPLFEAIMQWIEKYFSNEPLNGSVFIDPEGGLDGYLVFYEGEIMDGSMKISGKTLLSYYIDRLSSASKRIPSTIIWDLAEGSMEKEENADVNSLREIALGAAIKDLDHYKTEVLKERNRQAEIKEKYGLKSLDELMVKLDGEIIALEQRREMGENTDLSIRNKEEQKRIYEIRHEELKELIRKEKELTMNKPVFLGIIRVKHPETYGEGMKRDDEVERVGMEYVMKYEHSEGRTPEDISEQNLGFDIRSTSDDGQIRYIEVKARAGKGDVAISPNEWLNASKFGDDYYLYVVWNAKEKENILLNIIRNPSKNLRVIEKVESVRYIATADEIIGGNKHD